MCPANLQMTSWSVRDPQDRLTTEHLFERSCCYKGEEENMVIIEINKSLGTLR